jgi:phosphoglucosamine mutase
MGRGSRTSNLVLIGKDTRISGYMFESALEAGWLRPGSTSRCSARCRLPAVAYLTRTFRAAAGIVISASHNPVRRQRHQVLLVAGHQAARCDRARDRGRDRPADADARLARAWQGDALSDAAGRYIEYCKGTFPAEATLDGLKIVVDCAHGATYHVAPAVFEELGADVVALGVEPDGFNINRDAGSTSPQALVDAVLEHRADMGIALDGDGDRLICVDHAGVIVDGDELLYIIAAEQQRASGQCAGVVGTLMSNLGMEVALRELGIPFARAKVGDRYVLEMMEQRGWRLGGESSGHIICRDVTTTGDGIVSALRVLAAMSARGESLQALRSRVSKFPQTMINVRVGRQAELAGNGAIGDAVRVVENQLGERGRVLLRASGTEPVIRVMVEGSDAVEVERHAQALADVVRAVAS